MIVAIESLLWKMLVLAVGTLTSLPYLIAGS
jgi:hypothetical protein